MILDAYARNIFFSALLAEAGIDIPRLRGIRLMDEETPIDVKKANNYFGYFAHELIRDWFVKEAVRKYMPWQLHDYSITKNKKYFNRYVRLGTNTEWCVDRYYDYYGKDKEHFPWHRFHGKLRKKLKHLYKQRIKKAKKQYDTFNKYIGRSDVLCIYARIGGNNWEIYDGKEIEKQPWFLEKVDSCFDDTYCYIYVRLGETKGD